MLSTLDLSQVELNRIRVACGYLFSSDLALDDGFLKSLDLESIKNAFREKVKRYHPDLHGCEPDEMVERRRERFIKLRESYEMLKSYLPEDELPSSIQSIEPRTIIAVGGAKGGIGKSLFAANLGVFLAASGKRTVLVDLDLGGANLHLYLGKTHLGGNINDFLLGEVPTLEKVMVPTRYGPELIGGDSSRLGVANIPFVKKLKLLKNIMKIQADYVILDLGGDTSYNIIDFFLAADHGIVLTTNDPASYLEAYNFIKVALYRKLNRIYGPESSLDVEKDHCFQQIIAEATLSSSKNRVKTIGQLLERIKEEQPSNLFLINRVLKDFSPGLILNMVDIDSTDMDVVRRIQEVARNMLSIEVAYLGSLSYQTEIKQSAKDLVPVVARYPGGMLAARMAQLIEKINN